MEHSDNAAAVSTRALIAHLQQSVQSWMDGDRVLPADGSSLLAVLDRAMAGLAEEDAPAARAGIETFLRQVEAFIEAGVLEATDGRPRIEAAAATVALLRSADGTELEPRRGRTSVVISDRRQTPCDGSPSHRSMPIGREENPPCCTVLEPDGSAS